MKPISFNESTREQIIQILSMQPSLRAGQIFLRVQERGNKTTYQNVHKALNVLVTERVLVKNNQFYCLSNEWIQKIKKFAISLGSVKGN